MKKAALGQGQVPVVAVLGDGGQTANDERPAVATIVGGEHLPSGGAHVDRARLSALFQGMASMLEASRAGNPWLSHSHVRPASLLRETLAPAEWDWCQVPGLS